VSSASGGAAPSQASSTITCTSFAAGSTFNMELRWDGVRSLADAMAS
jgi:hypothetical protein